MVIEKKDQQKTIAPFITTEFGDEVYEKPEHLKQATPVRIGKFDSRVDNWGWGFSVIYRAWFFGKILDKDDNDFYSIESEGYKKHGLHIGGCTNLDRFLTKEVVESVINLPANATKYI